MCLGLDAETQLLLKCASPHSFREAYNIKDIDWDKFFMAFINHRMTNVVYENAKENLLFPALIRQRWKDQFVANKHRMLHYTAELTRVIQLLNTHGIGCIAIKGPMLGYLYYDDYTLRECSDLDVLVSSSNLPIAYKILTNEGYKATDSLWNSPKQEAVYLDTFHHYCLFNQNTEIQIELHWRLNSANPTTKAESDRLWANSISEKIGGVKITLLSKYDNFIYLCIHGSRHHWKRLFWVQDIARIIDKEGDTFVQEMYNLAKQQNSERYVLLAFKLASLLFEVNLPEKMVKSIQADKAIAKLVEISLFSIRMTTCQAINPFSSLLSFKIGVRKITNNYLSAYYLGGLSSFWIKIKLFFINPRYWRIYAFSDQTFLLNYFAAPFLWIYSVIKKYSI